jgi:hypothetical protein
VHAGAGGERRRPASTCRSLSAITRDGKTLGSYGVGRNFLEMNGYLHSLQAEQFRLVTELHKEPSTPPR